MWEASYKRRHTTERSSSGRAQAVSSQKPSAWLYRLHFLLEQEGDVREMTQCGAPERVTLGVLKAAAGSTWQGERRVQRILAILPVPTRVRGICAERASSHPKSDASG